MKTEKEKNVLVHADEKGRVIVPSEKEGSEYGHIHVSMKRMVIDETGFARKKVLHALIPGKIEDLEGFGWKAGQMVEGKIIIKERLEPFNPKEPERDIKIAGETGIPCLAEGGKTIYRKHFFTYNEDAHDVTVDHVNTAEIATAFEKIKESAESADKG